MLLNDDESIIQTCGLGIIANLILLPDSYSQLFRKVPHYVDMGLSFVMDLEEAHEKRKESVLLVNNFFSLFCKESQKDSLGSIAEAFGVFENCGFFDRLEDLMSSGDADPQYYDALTQLLLNLTIVDPAYMNRHFQQGTTLQYLLEIASPGYEPTTKHISDSDILNRFAKKQFVDSNALLIISTKTNIIQIIRLIMNDAREVASQLLNTTRISSIISENISCCREEISKPNPDTVYHRAALCTFGLLAELLADLSSQDLVLICGHGAGGERLIELLLYCIRQGADSQKIAFRLLSRLLATHFGEIHDLGLEDIISRECKLQPAGNGVIATQLYTLLLDAFNGESMSTDAIFCEDVLLCLQCLLGRSAIVKSFALADSLPRQLENRLLKVIGSGNVPIT